MSEKEFLKFEMPVISYNIVWAILIILHFLFLVKSILKLRDVLNEDKHSAQPLKEKFWKLVVTTTLSLFLFRSYGWSEVELVKLKCRFLFEYLMFFNNQLFTLVLFTTYSTVEVVFKMASGNTKAIINWTKYYKSIFMMGVFMILGSLWPVFNTVRFFKGCTFINKLGNIPKENVLPGHVIDGTWFGVFIDIFASFGFIELAARMWLVKMLIYVLWEISLLMKISKNLKVARKYKLREWGIFVSMCVFVGLCMGVICISLFATAYKWNFLLTWHLIPTINGQKVPESINNKTHVAVGRYDIIMAIMNIIIGFCISFLAPCRKVRK